MAIVLLFGALGARAAELLPAEFMTTDQIKPGMIGEGRTVFHGFKVEPFKVTILGVQHNALPGCDMIVGELEGPLLEKHGVVAGMSGSPVYVNGKLIGAVAYGWSFAYKPYCGITPIEQMYSVYQNIGQAGLTEASVVDNQYASSTEPWDWQSAWEAFQGSLQGHGGEEQGSAHGSTTTGFRPALPAFSGIMGELRPLASPLFLSGASPKVERMLGAYLGSQGLEMMGAGTMSGSGGAGVGQDEPAPPIEGGSALGVPMLTGDLSLSGVGTVTWRRGDKLIAFGHPMFFQGGSAAPMAQAYTLGFMQSYERSFKLSEVRGEIGTIDQDRLFAIGGKLGAAPPRVPITVRVHGQGASRPREYHFSCWKNHHYLPVMTGASSMQAFTASVADGGDLTANMNYRIALSDGRTIEKKFVESARGDLIDPSVMSLLLDMFLLVENPFHQADISNIAIDINVSPGLRQDTMITARPDHTSYRPGETVNLLTRFRPYRGEEYDRTFTMSLPSDLRPGSYVVHLADSRAALRIERGNHPERFVPRNFSGVVSLIQESDIADNQLRLYLFEPTMDLNLNGHAMNALPATMQSLIQATAPPQLQQPTVGRQIACQTVETAGPIQGSQSLVIQVVDHFND